MRTYRDRLYPCPTTLTVIRTPTPRKNTAAPFHHQQPLGSSRYASSHGCPGASVLPAGLVSATRESAAAPWYWILWILRRVNYSRRLQAQPAVIGNNSNCCMFTSGPHAGRCSARRHQMYESMAQSNIRVDTFRSW